MTVQRNSALGFIFVTLLIDIIGFGIMIPVLPPLIQKLTGGTLSEASTYGGFLIFTYATMQFICSPILGGLSDKYGRRPVLLASLLGLGIDYVFMAFAPTIAWLFVGRTISGICGASFTTASAYIADISTPEKRAQNFGMIGVAFGLGFIIGPAIGGIANKFLGLQAPFLVAAGLSLLNFLYGYFILPESLTPDHRRAFEWKRANPIGTLKNLGKYPFIAGLIFTLVLLYIAAHAVQSNWSFYTMLKFGWNSDWVGYSLAAVGVMIAIVQGGLIRVILPKLGQKNAVFVGLSLYTIGLVLFAFATTGWMMFLFLIPYCLGGITMPALQGIMSSQVPRNAQGELQGGLTSIMSVTSIVGPLIMNNLFAWFTGKKAPVYFPGAPFILGAIMVFVGILLSISTLKSYHQSLKQEEIAVPVPKMEKKEG